MRNNYFLGFSTQLNSTIKKDLNFAIENKFNAICLDWSWNPKMKLTCDEMTLLKRFSFDGNKIVFHMPFFAPTNSSIPDVSAAIIKYFKKAINLAKEIPADSITFHSGYVEQIANLKTHKYLINNIKEILKYAKKKKIKLSIENDDKCGDYPLWKEEEVIDILKSISGLNFTFDPGHANTAEINLNSFFDKVFNYTDIVHLHNNNGKDSHQSLNDGSIDYNKLLLQMLKKEDIIFILELFPYEKILFNRDLFMNALKTLNEI